MVKILEKLEETQSSIQTIGWHCWKDVLICIYPKQGWIAERTWSA
jgi:hypothetical protein